MNRDVASDAAAAIAQIPNALFLLTSQYEGRRAAVLVKWVQQCCDQPPMVMVALARVQMIEPVIRDSRMFALCQISANDRFLMRKFSQPGDVHEDALVSLLTSTAPSGSPIIDRAMCYLDCEVVRHIELDGDHRIYVGQVLSGAVLNRNGDPSNGLGTNGSRR